MTIAVDLGRKATKQANCNSKICLKRPLKRRPKMVFKTYYCLMKVKSIAEGGHSAILSSLNAGQKYCRMLQGEHSAILLTFIIRGAFCNIFDLH